MTIDSHLCANHEINSRHNQEKGIAVEVTVVSCYGCFNLTEYTIWAAHNAHNDRIIYGPFVFNTRSTSANIATPLSVVVDLLPDHRPHDVHADDVLESVVVQRIGQAVRSANNLQNLIRTFQIFHQHIAEFVKFAVYVIVEFKKITIVHFLFTIYSYCCFNLTEYTMWAAHNAHLW
ncbi:hypothetical protein T06_9362 [Trichinella sp. T6]|nr:hypothetical protein T06_9362 [Trichinella sp. T6]